MRCLSLFAGAGGGLLGEHLLGWEHAGAVELDDWRRSVLARRFPGMPLLADVRSVPANKDLFGHIDVVTAGFLCPPFSVVGVRLGVDDPRNGWPWTYDVLKTFRPKYAFLENVPGLLSPAAQGYFGHILANLMELGYGVRWMVLSAADVGAHHRRDRLWIRCDLGRVLSPPEGRPILGRVERNQLVAPNNNPFIEAPSNVVTTYAIAGGACNGYAWREQKDIQKVTVTRVLHSTAYVTDGLTFVKDDPDRYYDTLPRLLHRHFNLDTSGSRRNVVRLNPDWLEAYMGWPVGWTNPKASVNLDEWPKLTQDLWESTVESFREWPWHPLASQKLTKKRVEALGDGQVPQCVEKAWQLLDSPATDDAHQRRVGPKGVDVKEQDTDDCLL